MLKGIIRRGLCRVILLSGMFHFARFLSDRLEKTAVILCFHRVVDGSPDLYSSLGAQADLSRFKHQMKALSRLFSIIPFSVLVDQIKRGRIGPRSLVLTFDDGFRDSYTNVFPVLKEHRLPALFLLSPSMIGSSGLFWQNEPWCLLNNRDHMKPFEWGGRWWDLTSNSAREELNDFIRKNLFHATQSEREKTLAKLRDKLSSGLPGSTTGRLMLSSDEISEMEKSGLVELGAHSMTHAPFSTCTKDELDREIRQSGRNLESICRHRVSFFCYPFGDYTPDAIDFLEENGYIAAVTLDDGLVRSGDDLHLLKRISVVRDDTISTILAMKILPGYLKHIISHIKDSSHGYRKS